MKTFRVTHNNRRWVLVTNLFYLALMGSFTCMAFVQFSPASDPSGGISSRFPWAPWVFLLMFVLFAAMMTLLTIVIFKARLVFDEQGLTLETIIGPLKFMTGKLWKPFSLPYERILRVRVFDKPGRLELIDRQGAKYTLTPISFSEDHGEAVLAEFYARLPAEAFEPHAEMAQVRQYMARNRKLNRALVVVSLLYWIYLASLMAFNLSLSPPTWLNQAWQVRHGGTFGYESVETYSPDSRGAFWIVSYIPHGYRVYHFSGRVDDQWLLSRDLTNYDSPRLVSADETGSPIVWLDDRAFYYRDESWQSIPYDNLTLEIMPSDGVTTGRYCWIVKGVDQTIRLLKVDGLTGAWSPVPLPAAGLFPQSIQAGPDGRFLVLASGPAGQVVYGLSPEGWTGLEIPLGLEGSVVVRDYFLDGSGSLWVLFDLQDDTFVRKIAPGGKWLQTRLPALPDMRWQDGTRWYRYYALLVDASGRLWVRESEDGSLLVFTPVWDGMAAQIIRYSSDNSNFQAGYPDPILLPDGQIWSFDEKIATFDTTRADLPDPLPGWFASLNWPLLYFATLIGALLLIFILSIMANRRFSPRKPQPAIRE